eukprot:gene2866-8148_t
MYVRLPLWPFPLQEDNHTNSSFHQLSSSSYDRQIITTACLKLSATICDNRQRQPTATSINNNVSLPSTSTYNNIYLQRRLTTWVFSRICLRVCGSAGLRVYGSTGLRVCGSTGLRVYGSMGLWVYGSTGLRRCVRVRVLSQPPLNLSTTVSAGIYTCRKL